MSKDNLEGKYLQESTFFKPCIDLVQRANIKGQHKLALTWHIASSFQQRTEVTANLFVIHGKYIKIKNSATTHPLERKLIQNCTH